MRFLASATIICLVVMANQVSAYGDDEDDKNKNGKKPSRSISAIDTSKASELFDLGQGIINVDDTLVFEDWENPGNGGGQGDDINSEGSIDSDFDNNEDGIRLSKGITSQETVSKNSYAQFKVNFSIYPNPVMRTLHINPEITPSIIRIADLQGREHYRNEFTTQVDIYDLPAGTYFIQLVYDDHVESRRFLKK